MDSFDLIPVATKDMVHIFAARGLPHGEIGFLTHLSEDTVARVLAEPREPLSPELVEPNGGAVNTTSADK